MIIFFIVQHSLVKSLIFKKSIGVKKQQYVSTKIQSEILSIIVVLFDWRLWEDVYYQGNFSINVKILWNILTKKEL